MVGKNTQYWYIILVLIDVQANLPETSSFFICPNLTWLKVFFCIFWNGRMQTWFAKITLLTQYWYFTIKVMLEPIIPRLLPRNRKWQWLQQLWPIQHNNYGPSASKQGRRNVWGQGDLSPLVISDRISFFHL